MNRGEIWLAQVGNKRRPVVILTRTEVIDVRELVTVAEITTSMRGLATEVPIEAGSVDLDRPSVVNCDGLHTVRRSLLSRQVGQLDTPVLQRVCTAVSYALGC